MSRPRNPPAVNAGGFLMPADVAELWYRINPEIVPSETENWQIASVANYWNATVSCVEEQGRDKLAPAHRTLSKWCEAHRRDVEEGVGQFVPLAANNRILELGAALAAVRDLVEPLSRPKAMKIIAIAVWQEAERVLSGFNRPAGASPKSLAVRFTSAALIRLGHPDATIDAVSHVIRNSPLTPHKKIPRNSAAELGAKSTGANRTLTGD